VDVDAMTRPARIIYLIRRAQLLVYTSLADCLREYKLTPMQYMLLSVSRQRGEMSSAELARRFAVTPQSINEMIAALQRKHLILRKTATEHRRILRISLTADGARLLRICDREVDQLENRLFDGLSGRELRIFRKTLIRLIQSHTGAISESVTTRFTQQATSPQRNTVRPIHASLRDDKV
jgi:DNA-binding MarR family transcriptional regulator